MPELDEDQVLLAIGRLEGKMDGMGREIGDIKAALTKSDDCCKKCRDDIDTDISGVKGAIAAIEKTHTGEKAITSFLNTNIGRVVSVIGIVSGIIALVAIALPWIARVAGWK